MNYKNIAEDLLESMVTYIQSEHARTVDKRSKGESMVLKFLETNDGTATPNELCEKSNNSPARITAILDQLEEKGEIIRIADESDRRKITVKITRSGVKRSCKEYGEIRRRLETVLQMMEERDVKDFARTIKIFFEKSDQLNKQGQAPSFINKHRRV